MNRVALVVGHPDDVAFFFGGTAWLLKDRYNLHVLCASRGERGYDYSGPGLAPPSEDVARIRSGEEAEACRLLGAELTFLGQMDGEIYAGREACEKVAGILSSLKPAAVFTHHPLEKKDHSATFGIALQALQLANLFWNTELYMTVNYGSTYNAKTIDVCVDISSVIERKRDLIRCHKHHIKSETDVEQWVEPNRMLGRMAICDYAEGYTSALPVVNQRWKRKAGSILLDLPSPTGT
jgi:LmbE family N-acetylglucosaminyl deacetylase